MKLKMGVIDWKWIDGEREREQGKLNHYYDVELNSYRSENIIIIMNKDKINRMLYQGWWDMKQNKEIKSWCRTQ
jgi:hypothetical protein